MRLSVNTRVNKNTGKKFAYFKILYEYSIMLSLGCVFFYSLIINQTLDKKKNSDTK